MIPALKLWVGFTITNRILAPLQYRFPQLIQSPTQQQTLNMPVLWNKNGPHLREIFKSLNSYLYKDGRMTEISLRKWNLFRQTGPTSMPKYCTSFLYLKLKPIDLVLGTPSSRLPLDRHQQALWIEIYYLALWLLAIVTVQGNVRTRPSNVLLHIRYTIYTIFIVQWYQLGNCGFAIPKYNTNIRPPGTICILAPMRYRFSQLLESPTQNHNALITLNITLA